MGLTLGNSGPKYKPSLKVKFAMAMLILIVIIFAWMMFEALLKLKLKGII